MKNLRAALRKVCKRPRLSLVVISHNMSRELPRTLRSLGPDMQQGVTGADYEVIVVDNGSTVPFDPQACRACIPGLTILRNPSPAVSPVEAINLGLKQARGDLIGVMIDGARMASPGLLRTALEAARLHPRPVIGTLAFHLGPDVQMRSVANGYDQHEEDALLAKSDWEHDGYRLFDIAVPAASSAKGWFTVPAETNALFMRKGHWRELGGYDPGFVSPGGGLANLDIWKRGCEDPRNLVIMLLGEATFHQVHGGVATNSAKSTWPRFHEEYLRLRGQAYAPPQVPFRLYGTAHPACLATM
jgi:hypothetical protein